MDKYNHVRDMLSKMKVHLEIGMKSNFVNVDSKYKIKNEVILLAVFLEILSE